MALPIGEWWQWFCNRVPGNLYLYYGIRGMRSHMSEQTSSHAVRLGLLAELLLLTNTLNGGGARGTFDAANESYVYQPIFACGAHFLRICPISIDLMCTYVMS